MKHIKVWFRQALRWMQPRGRWAVRGSAGKYTGSGWGLLPTMQVFGRVGAGYWKQHAVKCLSTPTLRNQREQSRQVAPLVLCLSQAWLLVLGQPPERELHWLWNSHSKVGWDIILWLCNYHHAAQNTHFGLSMVPTQNWYGHVFIPSLSLPNSFLPFRQLNGASCHTLS